MDTQELQNNSIFETLQDLILTLWFILKSYAISICHFFISPTEKSVDGQIILITGGGNGIGRIMACEFAAKGATIVSWDINPQWNLETQEIVEKQGGTFKPYTVNVCDKHAVLQCAERVRREVGEVDILINNAGVVSGRQLTDLTEANIRKTFEVNVIAHFWTLQALLPPMMTRGHGHIVSIASIAGFCGVSRLSDYCSSKFAAVGLHESLVCELADYTGINTTLVCPFHITTGLFQGMKSRLVPSLEPDYVAKRIVKAVLTNQRQLMIGRDMYALPFIKSILPVDASVHLSKFLGDGEAMKKFVGHTEKKSN